GRLRTHDEDLDPLKVLAEMAGTALTNARQFQEQRAAAQVEARAAVTDELTGLPNRRHAARLLTQVRSGDSIVLIDVDHFRRVNERLGHAGGDDVLKALSQHLVAGLRTGDEVA